MTRALLATLFALAALPAHAAVVLYTDEAAYLAAVGATVTYVDFAGSPGATVAGDGFSPDVAFGSCPDSADPLSCGTLVFHNSNAITDLGGSASPNGVASLAWLVDAFPVYALGFNYVSGGIDAVSLVAADLSTTSVDTTAAHGFIGLVSDTPFFAGIGVNAVLAGGSGNDRYFIDDFRINGIAVPEPAGLVLLGLGLSGVAYHRRRAARAR